MNRYLDPRLKTHSLMLMTLILSVVCLIALTACGRKQEQPPNTITQRPTAPRQVAEDTPVKTYVKDSKGKKVLTNDVARAGEFVIGDGKNRDRQEAASPASKSIPKDPSPATKSGASILVDPIDPTPVILEKR